MGVLLAGQVGVSEKSFPLFRCPVCRKSGAVDDDQFHGRVSIVCPTPFCDYHETRDWSKEG